MEIEHLQMIIDAMRDATEGAFWLAVLWIGKSYAGGVAWLVIVGIMAWTAKAAVTVLSDGATERTRNTDDSGRERSDCVQAFMSMRQEDPAHKGVSIDYGHSYVSASDLNRVREIYAEGIAAIKARADAEEGEG